MWSVHHLTPGLDIKADPPWALLHGLTISASLELQEGCFHKRNKKGKSHFGWLSTPHPTLVEAKVFLENKQHPLYPLEDVLL